MDLQSIRYFVAVAEEGSFTDGARREHIVQSAASAAIGRLERELGVELFTRTGRRIEITEAGRVVLARARTMLAEAQAARDDVDALSTGLQGVLILGSVLSTGTFDLPRALHVFRERHPGVRVHTRLSSAPVYDHFGSLLDGTFDLLLAPMPPHLPPDISMEPIGHAQIVAVCGLGHPLASVDGATLAELAAHDQVDFPRGWGNRDLVDHAFRAAGVDRTVAIEVVDVATALGLAADDVNVGFVGEQSLGDRADVVTVDLAEPFPLVLLGVAAASHRLDEAALRHLRATILDTANHSEPLPDGNAPQTGLMSSTVKPKSRSK